MYIKRKLKAPCHSELRLGCSHLMAIPSFAFTLAETLITIGMIGVIAALTLPTLMNSTNEKENIAKLKKIYATLNEAHARAVATYGPVETWFINDSTSTQKAKRYGDRITQFLRVEKNCGMAVGEGCIPVFRNFANLVSAPIDTHADAYKIILEDGAAIAFKFKDNMTPPACGYIDVDIDGKKGKNTGGVDEFDLAILTDRVASHGVNSSWLKNKTQFGYLVQWIFNNDNMDYLKTTDGTCPNGTVLDWDTNTSCN